MSFTDNNLSQNDGAGAAATRRAVDVHTLHERRAVNAVSVSRRKPKKRRTTLKKNLKILAGLAAVIAVIYLSYAYIAAKNDLNKLSHPAQAAQDSRNQLVTEVGKLVDLPSGEIPSTATVSDAGKLKSQEFFARAQNGDKVLVYAKSGRAVLYRPSTNKVIEYSRVNLNHN